MGRPGYLRRLRGSLPVRGEGDRVYNVESISTGSEGRLRRLRDLRRGLPTSELADLDRPTTRKESSRMTRTLLLFIVATAVLLPARLEAHHVLGRPSYALNEDSNTPPAMQVETVIGDYEVNYMIFPAFPKPGEPGRINLYVRHLQSGQAYDGAVLFSVRDDTWLGVFGFDEETEEIGRQLLDDAVYRQNFQFSRGGDFIIAASFEADGEPYIIDFPLRIGAPSPWGPIGLAVAALAIVLVGVTLIQRRRAVTEKIRSSHRRRDEM